MSATAMSATDELSRTNNNGPSRCNCSLKQHDKLTGQAARSQSSDELSKLALSTCPKVRTIVAGNPNTSLETLQVLAQDKDAGVRSAVGTNIKTSNQLLAKLAHDCEKSVRLEIASSAETTIELLIELSLDGDRDIAVRARKSLRIAQQRLDSNVGQTSLKRTRRIA